MVRRRAAVEDPVENAEEIAATTRRTRKRASRDAVEEVTVKKQPRRNANKKSNKTEVKEEEEEEEVKIKVEPKEEGEENGCEKPSTSKRGRKKKAPAEDSTPVDDERPSTSKKVKPKEEIKVEPEEATPAKTPGGGKTKGRKKKEKVSGTSNEEKENKDTSNIPVQKSGAKTGVDRVVVVKGRAAVDALCPIAKTSHVYEEEDDIWDCMLNQTNIEFNNNKYYLIQLLESDAGNTFSVWMRWGRVGANGQNSLQPCGSDLEKAKSIFCNKFQNKTKNTWHERHSFEKVKGKYDLLAMDYSDGKDEPDSSAAKEEIKEKRKKGRKICLGTELEDKLKNLLKRMEKMGLGPTFLEFQDIVHDYLMPIK